MFISLAADIAAMRLTITGTRTRCEKDGAEADLRPSKHLLLHVCMETGMSDESGYTSATPPPSVPRLECLLLSSPSAALALVARPSGCVADMSSVRERRRYPHSAGDDAPEAGPGADSRLDLLTALPPEVAVNILRFLRGKDLCCVVLVSKAWCCLAQIAPFRARRLKYVQQKREKYLQLKENICPACRHLPTPQRTPRSSTHHPTTGSPLNCISTNRPDLMHGTTSNHTHAHLSHNSSSRSATRMTPYPVYSQLYPHSIERPLIPRLNCTPENADLFGGEMENDDMSAVRRCLFPFVSPSYSGSDRAVRRHSTTEQDASAEADSELDMKKSASRKRLKRL